MTPLNLDTPEAFEPVITHLVDRIRAFRQKTGSTKAFAWLFVHGCEEGASFELGIGEALADPQAFMADVADCQEECWDYADDWENGECTEGIGGEAELAQIGDWYQAWYAADEGETDLPPPLQYWDWQIVPLADGEAELVGFDVESEFENVFIQRIYRDILDETLKRYPDEIQGFVLEMHDSALPAEWIGGQD